MRLAALGFAVPLVVAGGYLWLTEQIPVMMFGDPLGPRAFPRLITAILVLAALLWVAEALVAGRRPAAADEEAGPAWLPAAVVAWFALYIVTLEEAGFVAGSAIFLLGMLAAFHRGHWLTNALVAVGVPLGAYLAFTRILSVSLPAGSLFPS
jgi:putative tricarboxylic transport membrane protein